LKNEKYHDFIINCLLQLKQKKKDVLSAHFSAMISPRSILHTTQILFQTVL